MTRILLMPLQALNAVVTAIDSQRRIIGPILAVLLVLASVVGILGGAWMAIQERGWTWVAGMTAIDVFGLAVLFLLIPITGWADRNN